MADSVVFDNLEETLLDVRNALVTDAPASISDEIDYEEDERPRSHRRHHRGEDSQPSPLQNAYQRQVRNNSRLTNQLLVEEMSKLVAWTYIPGRDRTECPSFVDIRDARLMSMDRFPETEYGECNRIALSMYRGQCFGSEICYAVPNNIEMFKDFSIRPHFRAGGLCLDSRNEEVFRVALALDKAMELVASNKMAHVPTFSPPPVMFGFPLTYTPTPEWRAPMQELVRKTFQLDTPILSCLLSPGGTIDNIRKTADDFQAIDVLHNGDLVTIKVPTWAVISPEISIGSLTAKGQPLADVPRGDFKSIKEVTQRHPYYALKWLEECLVEELTEMVTVDEEVFDRDTQTRTPIQATWRCLPSQYVQKQYGHAVRHFLDFRSLLGRDKHTIDGQTETDVWTTDPTQVRVQVMRFDSRPSFEDLLFHDGPTEDTSTWFADLITPQDGAPWADKIPERGYSDVEVIE